MHVGLHPPCPFCTGGGMPERQLAHQTRPWQMPGQAPQDYTSASRLTVGLPMSVYVAQWAPLAHRQHDRCLPPLSQVQQTTAGLKIAHSQLIKPSCKHACWCGTQSGSAKQARCSGPPTQLCSCRHAQRRQPLAEPHSRMCALPRRQPAPGRPAAAGGGAADLR